MVTLAALGLTSFGVVLALWYGSVRRARRTARFAAQLLGQSAPARPAAPVDFASFDTVPAPVARYLRFALRDGQPLIRVAHFSQSGQLRTRDTNDRWSRFEATETVTPRSPGFIWNARVAVAPLVHVHVRDGYLDGLGSGEVSLFSALRLSSNPGGPELSSGALYRYLAEAVWYPTALLPGQGVRWTSMDEESALATLSDGGNTVAVEYRFGDGGEVTAIYASGRHRRVNGGYVKTGWEGHFRSYERRGGVRIPLEGEVGWYLSGEWRRVWQGRILAVNYEWERP